MLIAVLSWAAVCSALVVSPARTRPLYVSAADVAPLSEREQRQLTCALKNASSIDAAHVHLDSTGE